MAPICPVCRVGRLQPRMTSYVRWLGDSLLVVNRVPAMVCDMCGERTYDEHILRHLQRLLMMSDLGVAVASRPYYLA
ncbi:MAG: type II toxin-antitoxin system MqsA family antitoxin [Anaerolineae bacterium]|nr:type II toxin-antitoxin system MqsA family antitoxin [Anaerolineae bacterium]MDW8070232.1 type II toxin-antitoxin system MqsA family antitoxin [Anaerolineae bacterium]